MPCAANSLLNEEGLPVVCETDIHGAITAVMAEAALRQKKREGWKQAVETLLTRPGTK